jgi:hypothetical protein
VSKLRWYVDADTLGLAKILIQVRQDVTFPGDDGKRPHHKRDVDPCVIASNARMFAMTSPESLDKWGQLEVVVSQWRAMERAADEPGPYIYSLTRTTLKKIDV